MTNKRSRLIDTLVNNVKLKNVIASRIPLHDDNKVAIPMRERDLFLMEKKSLSLSLCFSLFRYSWILYSLQLHKSSSVKNKSMHYRISFVCDKLKHELRINTCVLRLIFFT